MAVRSVQLRRWGCVQIIVVSVVWFLAAGEKATYGQGGAKTPPGTKLASLLGAVTDEVGQPLPGVDVFVVAAIPAKASYTLGGTKTGEDGRFELTDAYPLGEPSVIDVTAYHRGRAFSHRRLENEGGQRFDDQMFRLERAAEVQLRIVDSQGRPASGARLSPKSRKSSDGTEHRVPTVIANRTPSLRFITDSDGGVTLDMFHADDSASISILASGVVSELAFSVGQGGKIGISLPDQPAAGVRVSPAGVKRSVPNPQHVEWVAQHAVRLQSIDPAETDFGDLAPLKEMIGDASIVMLGEQSHGDGAAFHAKTRLIKFLHQEMSFDVLVFESGLYDCRRAWQAFREGRPAREAGALGIFGIWSASQEVQPLLGYLAENARGQRPLELAGMDIQMTGAASLGLVHLERDILALAGKLSELIDRGTVDTLVQSIRKLAKREPLGDQAEALIKACAAVREAIAKASGAVPEVDEELRFWDQYFKGLAVFGRQRQPGLAPKVTYDLRDQQMAENLAWLKTVAFPNRKLIVWAASSHLMANPDAVRTLNGAGRELIPMGHTLRTHIDPQQIFTMAFTAWDGTRGAFAAPPRPFPKYPGSLEDIFQRTNIQNFVLSLRSLSDDGKWLATPLVAGPHGYLPEVADWTRVYDALVFTRTMYPSTPAARK